MNTYYHIGLDFIDASGKRTTTVCLVDMDAGKTVGICDFLGDSLVRLIVIDGFSRESFQAEAERLRQNSIPVRFIETKLP